MASIEPSDRSIIREIESSVIIAGDTHEALWNVPKCASLPGDPPTGFLRVNVADRHGKDQSFGRHTFRSNDLFETLETVEDAGTAFDRVLPSIQSSLPEFPDATGHAGYAPPVWLDADTAIKSFTFQRDGIKNWVTTARCEARGRELHAIALGNAHTIENSRRGLYEPHLVRWKDTFYMTGRAEDGHGYLLTSEDGLTWSPPHPWTWDSGGAIPMDQTMTKLLSHPDGLVLVYTRIREDNTATFRHRAPLHAADLDPDTCQLIRETERIIVPDRGMAVGNFWAWPLTRNQTVIFTAEWPRDGRTSNGDIWICRINWRNPNLDLTPDGNLVAVT